MKFYPRNKNVGGWDRILRLVLGPFLLALAIAGALEALVLGPVVLVASAIVGAVLTVTGLTQKCPLSQVLGMDTFRGDSPEPPESEREPPEQVA